MRKGEGGRGGGRCGIESVERGGGSTYKKVWKERMMRRGEIEDGVYIVWQGYIYLEVGGSNDVVNINDAISCINSYPAC